MPRRKADNVIQISEPKATNDALLTVGVEINGGSETFEILVKDFCCNVTRVHQNPETILAAMIDGLEAHFGKKVSLH